MIGRHHARPHSVPARLHPCAMWSAMQASCCDHGLRPRTLARHVVMSPVRGFCIVTSVAQPANRHAVTRINSRYRNGIASLQLDRPQTRVVHIRRCGWRSMTIVPVLRCVLPLAAPPTPMCVSVPSRADRRVASPRSPVGSTSPHPGPERELLCRRSGWPAPGRA